MIATKTRPMGFTKGNFKVADDEAEQRFKSSSSSRAGPRTEAFDNRWNTLCAAFEALHEQRQPEQAFSTLYLNAYRISLDNNSKLLFHETIKWHQVRLQKLWEDRAELFGDAISSPELATKALGIFEKTWTHYSSAVSSIAQICNHAVSCLRIARSAMSSCCSS